MTERDRSEFGMGRWRGAIAAALVGVFWFGVFLAASYWTAGFAKREFLPAVVGLGALWLSFRAFSKANREYVGSAAPAASVATPASVEAALRQATAYRAELQTYAYIIPGERDADKRWLVVESCTFCAREASKTGNVANMLLLGVPDPREFHEKYGMGCSAHAHALTELVAPDVARSLDALKELIARAHVEMERQSTIYDVDHPFETNSPAVRAKQVLEREQVLAEQQLQPGDQVSRDQN